MSFAVPSDRSGTDRRREVRALANLQYELRQTIPAGRLDIRSLPPGLAEHRSQIVVVQESKPTLVLLNTARGVQRDENPC